MSRSTEPVGAGHAEGTGCTGRSPEVSVVRAAHGWAVVSPGGAEDVGDLVEGLALADLVAEEYGTLVEPDRAARLAARGRAGEPEAETDPRDVRLAALERTVAQLEHALAARVSIERAVGVLAERHGISLRCAFELLRGQARSQGRAVHDLAREVLDGLSPRSGAPASPAVAPPRGPGGTTAVDRTGSERSGARP